MKPHLFLSSAFSFALLATSTPAVADGRVFALNSDGKFLCLDAAKGQLQWSKLFRMKNQLCTLLGAISLPALAVVLVAAAAEPQFEEVSTGLPAGNYAGLAMAHLDGDDH